MVKVLGVLELNGVTCRAKHRNVLLPTMDERVRGVGLVAFLLCNDLDWRNALIVDYGLTEGDLRERLAFSGSLIGQRVLAVVGDKLLDLRIFENDLEIHLARHLPNERARIVALLTVSVLDVLHLLKQLAVSRSPNLLTRLDKVLCRDVCLMQRGLDTASNGAVIYLTRGHELRRHVVHRSVGRVFLHLYVAYPLRHDVSVAAEQLKLTDAVLTFHCGLNPTRSDEVRNGRAIEAQPFLVHLVAVAQRSAQIHKRSSLHLTSLDGERGYAAVVGRRWGISRAALRQIPTVVGVEYAFGVDEGL